MTERDWARPEGRTWPEEEAAPGRGPEGLPGLLDCVHCGLCLAACATFRATGDEALSPRGRLHLLRAVAEERLPAVAADPALESCLLCRACEPVCPSRVPYHRLLAQHREGRTPPLLAAFLAGVLPRRRRLAVVGAGLRLARRSGLLAVAERLPWRRLQALAGAVPTRPRRFFPPPGKRWPAAPPRRGRIGLHLGCVTAELMGGVLEDTVRLLTAQGFEVVAPAQPACCGAVHGHAGDEAGGHLLAAATLEAFPGDLDAIVVAAAGCSAWLHEHDPRRPLLDPLVLLAREGLRPLPGSWSGPVVHSPPCHLQHVLGARQEVEAVLAAVPGLELLPLPEAELCCGAGGIAFARAPAVADAALARRLDAIAAAGAAWVAAGNAGCLLRLEAGLRRRRLPVRAVHPVSILATAAQG